ncbi:MAG: branched-chain amino acid aminotransferase, partial [Negativicutes bacterium]|nr:branched-chain amino acid aminotransferase [Negativicutes bacterium]
VLQYAQTCFEGLKAYTTVDGKVVLFRPDLNGQRLEDSCRGLEMPVYPTERFVSASVEVVRANLAYVPPAGHGAAMYLRPFMIGTDPVLGVKPASEYQFRIFVSPVGPYFKGGIKPLTLKISTYDRAAPRGTGHIKAGLNYAMSLHPLMESRRAGYNDNLYPDPATRTKVEEASGANFLFVTADGKLVTPRSASILPSITRRSLLYVAEHYLSMPVEEREVYLDELPGFVECGLCGTAAVISPVGRIVGDDREINFASGMETIGPVLKKLYDTLTGIQTGAVAAPPGWLVEVC